MSGGSWGYAYKNVRTFAECLRADAERDAKRERKYFSPLQTLARAALAEKLDLISEAMRFVEYVDSNDNAPGDEVGPILDAIHGLKPVGWNAWLESRPGKVRDVATKLPPWKHYTLTGTGQVVLIKSYGEEKDGGAISLTVIVIFDPRPPKFVAPGVPILPPYEVFGVKPEMLDEKVSVWPEGPQAGEDFVEEVSDEIRKTNAKDDLTKPEG